MNITDDQEIQDIVEFIYLNREGIIEQIGPQVKRHMMNVEKATGFVKLYLTEELDDLIINLVMKFISELFYYSQVDMLLVFDSTWAEKIKLKDIFTNNKNLYII